MKIKMKTLSLTFLCVPYSVH